MRELREFEMEIVDKVLGAGVVFVVTGRGRINCLRLEVFSVAYAVMGEVM